MTLVELIGKIGFTVDAAPLDAASARLEGIKRRLDFLSAVEVIKGIFALTERFSQFAEGLNTAAAAAGVTVESLQRLQFAASQAGVGSEEMGAGLGVLSRKLYDARKGGEEALKAFAAVGIGEDQVKSFRTTSDALAAISDRMAGMSDPIAKQALAMDLLGRGGSKMVGFLSGGSKAMREAGASAEEMGAIVSGPTIQALGDVEDSISGMWQVVKAFSATVAAMFAPSITSAVKALEKFYAANRAIIMSSIRRWVYDFTFALGYLYGVIEVVIAKLFQWASAHPELVKRIGQVIVSLMAFSFAAGIAGRLMGLLKATAGVAGDAIGGMKGGFNLALGSVSLLRAGIVRLLAWMAVATATAFPALSAALSTVSAVLMATPIGWVIAGLAAIVLGVEAIYTTFFKKGGNWKDTWIYQIFEKLGDVAKWIGKKMGLGGAKDLPDVAPATTAAAAQGAEAPQGGMMADFMRQAQAFAGQKGADMAAQMGKMGDLGKMQAMLPGKDGGLLAGAGGDMLPPAAAPSTQINAPITINVPQGTPTQDVADKVKAALREHLDRTHREAQRSTRTALAY